MGINWGMKVLKTKTQTSNEQGYYDDFVFLLIKRNFFYNMLK